MAKNNSEKIETISRSISDAEKEIQQLENRVKRLSGSQSQLARKARTRRLIERGAILESLIADAETLTNEQVKAVLLVAFHTAAATDALQKVRSEAAAPSSLV